MPASPATSSPRARRSWASPAVFFLAALIFSPVLSHDFTWWDDHDTIHQNPHFNPPTAAGIGHYWRHAHMALYVPVTYTVWGLVALTSHGLGSGVHGVELPPAAFHAVSVLVHALAAVVVFLLLRRLVARDWPAAAGAVLFAVHPVQVEAVAWASGLKDLLCGLFSMLALLHYVRFAQARVSDERASGRVWYLAALVAFVLALLSKPTAVVVPAVAAVLDLLVLRRRPGRVAAGLAPLVVLSIAFSVIAKLVQPAPWVQAPSLWARPLVAADAVAFYLWKLIFPFPLAPDYGRNPANVLGSGGAYFTWIVPAAVTVVLLVYRRRYPWLLSGALIFVVGVAPVLGLVRFTFQTFSTVADHYVYISMLGPGLIAAFLVSRSRTAPALLGSVIVLLILAALSILQMRHWRDHPTLWTHTARVNPRSFAAWNNLGAWQNLMGRPDSAAPFFIRALEINPDHLDSRDNLARYHAMRGEHNPAVLHMRAFIASAEKLPAESRPPLAGVYQNLARALDILGRPSEAAEARRRAEGESGR